VLVGFELDHFDGGGLALVEVEIGGEVGVEDFCADDCFILGRDLEVLLLF